jgi:putative transcription antitermination factor YqgF
MGKKILSLDVGRVRVGVACIDDRGAVIDFKTVARAQGNAERELQTELSNLDELVVGVPLDENDQLTDTCIDIFKFCRRLLRRTPNLSLKFVDEYGTSLAAEGLVGNSMSARRSGAVDQEAAKSILKLFLERGADERIAASFHAWLKEGIKDQK